MKNRHVKIGDLIRVTKNADGHNYTIGETYRVTNLYDKNIQAESLDGCWHGNYIAYDCFKLTNLNKEYYLDQIDKLQFEIDEVRSIMAWMDETGNDTYNPDEHRVWQALTLLENDKMSKGDKVKLIAKLIHTGC